MSNSNNNINEEAIKNALFKIKLEDEYTVNRNSVKLQGSIIRDENYGFCVKKSERKYVVTIYDAVRNKRRITKQNLKLIADHLSYKYLKTDRNGTVGSFCSKRNDTDWVEKNFIQLKEIKIMAEQLFNTNIKYELDLLDLNKYIGISVLSFKQENNVNCLNLQNDDDLYENVFFLFKTKIYNFKVDSTTSNSRISIFQSTRAKLENSENKNPDFQLGLPVINKNGDLKGIIIYYSYDQGIVDYLPLKVINRTINDIEVYNEIVLVRPENKEPLENVEPNYLMDLFLNKKNRTIKAEGGRNKNQFYQIIKDKKGLNLTKLFDNDLEKYDGQICYSSTCEDDKYYKNTKNEKNEIKLRDISRHIYIKCENDNLEDLVRNAMFDISTSIEHWLIKENNEITKLNDEPISDSNKALCVNNNGNKYLITGYEIIHGAMSRLDEAHDKLNSNYCNGKIKSEIKIKANQTYKMTLIESNEYTLLSVLRFDANADIKKLNCLKVSQEQPKVNDENIILFDLADWHFTRGFIENDSYVSDQRGLFHRIKTETLSGDSNLPLFNNKSEIIGFLAPSSLYYSNFIPQNYLIKVLDNISKYSKTTFFYPLNLHQKIKNDFKNDSSYFMLNSNDSISSINGKSVSNVKEILNLLFLSQPDVLKYEADSKNKRRFFYIHANVTRGREMMTNKTILALEIQDHDLKELLSDSKKILRTKDLSKERNVNDFKIDCKTTKIETSTTHKQKVTQKQEIQSTKSTNIPSKPQISSFMSKIATSSLQSKSTERPKTKTQPIQNTSTKKTTQSTITTKKLNTTTVATKVTTKKTELKTPSKTEQLQSSKKSTQNTPSIPKHTTKSLGTILTQVTVQSKEHKSTDQHKKTKIEFALPIENEIKNFLTQPLSDRLTPSSTIASTKTTFIDIQTDAEYFDYNNITEIQSTTDSSNSSLSINSSTDKSTNYDNIPLIMGVSFIFFIIVIVMLTIYNKVRRRHGKEDESNNTESSSENGDYSEEYEEGEYENVNENEYEIEEKNENEDENVSENEEEINEDKNNENEEGNLNENEEENEGKSENEDENENEETQNDEIVEENE